MSCELLGIVETRHNITHEFQHIQSYFTRHATPHRLLQLLYHISQH